MNQQEWRNQASLVNYPFASNASRTSLSGTSELRTSDIVDAHIVARTPDERDFHISQMDISSETISGVITSSAGDLGTFSIARSQAAKGSARILDSAGIDRGVIVLGSDDQQLFDLMASGVSEFGPEALSLHECTVFHPPASRVATISIDDIPLYGRVRLRAGTGIRFELVNEGGLDTVIVHATGAQVEKDCGTGKPIKNFNSVPPDGNGLIFIRPSPYANPENDDSNRQVLRITSLENEHAIMISIAGPEQ
jgi:hypothetical protein